MFKCEDCGVNLHLIVTEENYTNYKINDDGSLEYEDSDGYGQEIHLECHECCAKYEFDNQLMTVVDIHKLDLFGRGEFDLNDIGIKKQR